jgi:hypothetical protein
MTFLLQIPVFVFRSLAPVVSFSQLSMEYGLHSSTSEFMLPSSELFIHEHNLVNCPIKASLTLLEAFEALIMIEFAAAQVRLIHTMIRLIHDPQCGFHVTFLT